MKKHVLFLCFCFIIANLLSQVYDTLGILHTFEHIPDSILINIDKMGIDENSELTELEGNYFNALFQIEKKEFDMSGKKVGFFSSIKSDKKEYFDCMRIAFEHCTNNDTCKVYFGTLYVFFVFQKEESGGYDVAIVDGCCKILPTTKKVVKRLKKTSNQVVTKNCLHIGEEINLSLAETRGRTRIHFYGNVPEGNQVQVFYNGKMVYALIPEDLFYSSYIRTIPAKVKKVTVRFMFTPSTDFDSNLFNFCTTIWYNVPQISDNKIKTK
jgi:hypothetical protein